MRVARIELPADPASAATARAYINAALANSPRRNDAEQVVTELIAETLSQGAHGEMVLTVEHDDTRCRITLDSTERPALRGESDERTLVIADAVADGIGHRYTAATGESIMWAEFTWTVLQ